MARGIISTILGGVAGGLQGAEMQQRQRQERQDRLAEEERRRLEREADFAFRAAQFGATPSARLRTDEAAVAEQRLRDTPISRVMAQAPLFEEPSKAPVGRSAVEAALQARVPAPDFSAERRGIPQFTPMTEDEEYLQITSPGGQVFSMMTPEALERRRIAEEERVRGIGQEERQMTNREAHATLVRRYSESPNYDASIDYVGELEQQRNLEARRASRPPVAQQEALGPLDRLQNELLSFISKDPDIAPADLYTRAVMLARLLGVDENTARAMTTSLAGPPPPEDDDVVVPQARTAPLLEQLQTEQATQARREETRLAERQRLEDNLRQYEAALAQEQDPDNIERLRVARAQVLRRLNDFDYKKYPLTKEIIQLTGGY